MRVPQAGEGVDMPSNPNAKAPQRPSQRELVLASLLKAPAGSHDAHDAKPHE